MNQKRCRSCELIKDNFMRDDHHEIEALGRFCPICQKITESIHHGLDPEGDMFGESFECNECNSYIIYTDDFAKNIWKDEYYLSDDRFLIRDFGDSSTSLCIGGEEIIELPFVLDISNREKLIHKFQTYTLFA